LEALRGHGHWELLDAILTEVGDHDESPIGSGVTPIGLDLGGGISPDGEGVRRCGGGLLPLDSAVTLLCPHTVVVDLSLEKLTALKVVGLDTSSGSREILNTVCWGLPLCSAGDLSGEDVVFLGCCQSTADIGVGQCDCVSAGRTKLHIHVIVRVCPANV